MKYCIHENYLYVYRAGQLSHVVSIHCQTVKEQAAAKKAAESFAHALGFKLEEI